jgi:hypothetical protein
MLCKLNELCSSGISSEVGAGLKRTRMSGLKIIKDDKARSARIARHRSKSHFLFTEIWLHHTEVMQMVVIRDEQFYSIGETCGLLGAEAHTLRFWEKEFRDFLKPLRNARGDRLYSRKDIETLTNIRDLLTIELYTLAGARRQMYLRQNACTA